MRNVLSLVVLAVLLAGCAASPAGSAAPGPASHSRPPDALTVEIDRGNGSPAESYRLTCGTTVTGNHPDGAAACAHLESLADPFAPIPADRMCSQIYGGPQTAHVTGRWKGAHIDVRLSRVDGCRTEQWNSLGLLLPGPVGVSPPS